MAIDAFRQMVEVKQKQCLEAADRYLAARDEAEAKRVANMGAAEACNQLLAELAKAQPAEYFSPGAPGEQAGDVPPADPSEIATDRAVDFNR